MINVLIVKKSAIMNVIIIIISMKIIIIYVQKLINVKENIIN